MVIVPNKTDKLWVTYTTNGIPTHAIISDLYCTNYTLCEVDGEKLKKTKHKSTNPLDLEKFVYEQ